ncbi:MULTISPECIES: PTS transporter subunit EIIC [Bacillaceae]|uniref:PTS transporter subunit EIIC n=1 Tax=Bacillaceae TaxID=186817 RepID=UPI001E32DE26|nr:MULTISPECIES: PTS transporter subunit EIIC [Bacillaceae]MCE4047599.1 PTS transporter subunit EIIC [Bacillus sp. Au-Bac7]MCM3034012.1 PTS transporter subunit EIIC [Niallia sp. MER 6]
MDYTKLAESVVSEIGGKENVSSITHCMTRLRFVLKDESKANTEAIKKIQGVLGTAVSGGQYQIIVGTGVSKAYDQVIKLLSIEHEQSAQNTERSSQVKEGAFNRFFKLISGILFPVMGVMTAAGIIKGLLAGFTSFQLLSTESGTYQILYAFSDGFFYFMPIILGVSAAMKLNSNPFVAATIGAGLVYPNITALYNEGAHITFLQIPVVLASYGNSVFPIIAAVALAAFIEKRIKDKVPDAVKFFLTPLLVLIITVPTTFLLIGPLMTYLSDILASGTQAVYGISPVITGIILGAFWQLVVIFGLHYAFIPILMNNITTMGEDPINAILNVTVFALAGAAIGFALKQKDKANRSLGFSTGMTGLFGVTEPIIYSIAIPYKKPFVAAFIGGGIAGGITAFMNAKMYGFGGNALFAAPLFINPKGIDSSFTAYIISALVAFFVTLAITYILTGKQTAKLMVNKDKGREI